LLLTKVTGNNKLESGNNKLKRTYYAPFNKM